MSEHDDGVWPGLDPAEVGFGVGQDLATDLGEVVNGFLRDRLVPVVQYAGDPTIAKRVAELLRAIADGIDRGVDGALGGDGSADAPGPVDHG